MIKNFLHLIIEQLAKFGEKIDTLTKVVMELKDEIRDLKELKEAQKSHDFLMVRIFDILYILITLNSNYVFFRT
jgi:hypothetical protein